MTPPNVDLTLFQQGFKAIEEVYEFQELNGIRAESIGWLPLAQGAYLHRGAQAGTLQDDVIEVVGVVNASMVDANVLWFT